MNLGRKPGWFPLAMGLIRSIIHSNNSCLTRLGPPTSNIGTEGIPMRWFRFNIAGLIVFILICGIAFAALKESTDLWEHSVFSFTRSRSSLRCCWRFTVRDQSERTGLGSPCSAVAISGFQ